MKDYIEHRVIELANYIIDNNSTVRAAAKEFHISKSTVHKDVTERLQKLNSELSKNVSDILNVNKSERHIRGGIATKEKYKKLRTNT
ncbi:MAG: sporulation transcriptional regulator SpoIIID [Clostridia bacterium]|nr:sporulation transcriptional regulator SpoIIID [Clostridia bacterium]